MPVPISEEQPLDPLPSVNLDILKNIRHFVAEDEKMARRFLKLAGYPVIQDARIGLLNEHSQGGELSALLEPLINGHDVALMSDAGCPGIADPGADLIRAAHARGIRVRPLTGPSSIVLSVMASGFNGQNFSFVGYLPVDKMQRTRRLKELEARSRKERQAQFFIETPYRNDQMFETMLQSLAQDTRIFVGKGIGTSSEFVLSRRADEWKKNPPPSMHKVPVVFGLFSGT